MFTVVCSLTSNRAYIHHKIQGSSPGVWKRFPKASNTSPKLGNQGWLAHFAFMVDITTHHSSAVEPYKVTSFVTIYIAHCFQLCHWKTQLVRGDTTHFPTLVDHRFNGSCFLSHSCFLIIYNDYIDKNSSTLQWVMFVK